MAKPITTVTQIQKAIRQVKQTGEQTALPLAGYKGLEMRIRPSGDDVTATFRHRYTHPYTAKRPYMTIGQFPAMTLEQARKAHHDNMALLAQRIDPLTNREQQKQAQAAAMNNGFNDIATRWIADKTNNKDSMPAAKTIKEWQRVIAMAVNEWGNTPIKDITPPMVLKLCNNLQGDRVDTGRRVRSMCERIFTYAIGHGLIDVNPALQIKGLLKTAQTTHQHAITKPLEFAQLLKDIDALKDSNERTALQLIALLFTRGGDTVAAKWADIDLDAALWTLIPQKGQGRSDMVDELLIPLPAQAIAILKEQHKKTGMYEHVFHTHRTRKTKHTNIEKLSVTLSTMNNERYKGKHVPHGFRASALTMIQEQLGYAHNLPDMQLGHTVKDNNGAAYNRAKFITERTEMLQKWADYQDELRTGTSLIRANFKQPKEQKQG
uniref:tyrosine-type recombinase/integrase n=1 Tax=Psychrobacter sp. TaxID=56811 RepID=UPI0015979FDD|nr:integrase arm-type DNA-binding domain-containing protein [Psychrobacter sp.]QJS05570.1 bacteriophage P4 integrase [Psychrobacter sp.]